MRVSKKNPIRFVVIAALLIAFFVFLQFIGAIPSLRSLASGTLAPIYTVASRIVQGASGTFIQTESTSVLQEQVHQLEEENLELKRRLAQLEDTAFENETLRRLLDYFEVEAPQLPRVIARVVGRDPETPSLLLLNVGLRDGVQKHNAVIVGEGVLIAKILDVSATTSRALLLTDSESSVAVTVSGGSPTSKLAIGERGLSIILDQIPQQEQISIGQLVISSGLEPTIPRGLLVGEVEELISESNDLFQRAVLRPLVDSTELSLVAVILSEHS